LVGLLLLTVVLFYVTRRIPILIAEYGDNPIVLLLTSILAPLGVIALASLLIVVSRVK